MAVGKEKLNGLEGRTESRILPRATEWHRIHEFLRNLDVGRRLAYSSGMAIAQQIALIDERLASAHLVLLDLASGHPVPGDSPAIKAALADLEAARELLHGLAAGPGQN